MPLWEPVTDSTKAFMHPGQHFKAVPDGGASHVAGWNFENRRNQKTTA